MAAGHHDMGEVDMGMPGGLPMAERGEDRDRLKLDRLHVPLGPVLPDWPAGLLVRLVVVPVLLAAFTAVAVTADALLAARAAGRRVPPTVLVPLAEVPRLLAAQRRTTLAPDSLLWRFARATVPAAGVLAAVVIPFGQVTVSRTGPAGAAGGPVAAADRRGGAVRQ
jgi:hypothetical protein